MSTELNHLIAWDVKAFIEHPLVSQPKELTDRIWNNIKDTLVEFIKEKEVERLEEARLEVMFSRDALAAKLYKDWLATQALTEPFPSVADICLMKEFNDVIVRPADQPVKKKDFNPAIATLPQFVEEWRAKAKLELCKVLPALPEDHPNRDNAWKDPQRLDLATTIFGCGCFNTVSYPRVLFHRCLTSFGMSDCKVTDDLTARFERLNCVPWGYRDKQRCAVPASRFTRTLVQACGLDPETTTKIDMDELDPKFMCLECAPTAGGWRRVMAWNNVVCRCLFHLNMLLMLTWCPLLGESSLEHAQKHCHGAVRWL
ncbi:hypothetical protein NEOLEDRAFT_1057588 [Neolentinus lepideus HHB14362 ss-1]|uniref:Uncharacterized protein n=1 Tax=Neolentinus lepideus HHB14362 ss-1 TaxID=1314782 RepID=A0A165UV43_9AGAM|nr:hypothetical protein NEOLEDRAFT_1057588 [Neolentinus lepideus HHB14362 ss-1]